MRRSKLSHSWLSARQVTLRMIQTSFQRTRMHTNRCRWRRGQELLLASTQWTSRRIRDVWATVGICSAALVTSESRSASWESSPMTTHYQLRWSRRRIKNRRLLSIENLFTLRDSYPSNNSTCNMLPRTIRDTALLASLKKQKQISCLVIIETSIQAKLSYKLLL